MNETTSTVKRLYAIFGRQEDIGEAMAVQQSAVSAWLNGQPMSRQSMRLAQAILTAYDFALVWVLEYVMKATSGGKKPWRLTLWQMTFEKTKSGRYRRVSLESVELTKPQREETAARLAAKYATWSCVVYGGAMCCVSADEAHVLYFAGSSVDVGACETMIRRIKEGGVLCPRN